VPFRHRFFYTHLFFEGEQMFKSRWLKASAYVGLMSVAVVFGLVQMSEAAGTSPWWEKPGSYLYYNDTNVGIGTSTPSQALNVKGTVLIENTGSGSLQLRPSTSGGDSFVIEHPLTTGDVYIRSTANGQNDGDILMNDVGGGKVGIGTASPDHKLSVTGDFRVSGTSYLSNLTLTDGSDITGLDILRGYNDLRLQGDPTGGTDLYIAADGKVGVGTTSPATHLHTSGALRADDNNVLYTDGTSNDDVIFRNDGSYWYLAPWGTNATNETIIVGGGSSTNLTVTGGVKAEGGAPGAGGANNNGYAFGGNGGDNDSGMFSSADGQVDFYADNELKMRVTAGDICIGNCD
jgi:hypothetical protein